MKHAILSILIAASLALFSCVGTDVGNPAEDEKAEVELHFSGYEETRAGALVLDDGTRLDEAWLGLGSFRFQAASDCDGEAPFDAAGPVAVDLLADDPSYDAPLFTKPVTQYCKLDVGFAPLSADRLPAGAPAGLEGRSLYVEGERADGVSFRIEVASDRPFKLNGAAENFELVEGEQILIVGFALDEWISGDRLDAIDDEEPIVINAESNAELLGPILASVKRSARLFRDKNENRRLDPDEQRSPIAEGAAENGDDPREGESQRRDDDAGL
jgi:hypothetical protein